MDIYDDDAASDVFLDDWESGTGVVPLFALLWVLDLGWMAPVWGGWPLFGVDGPCFAG